MTLFYDMKEILQERIDTCRKKIKKCAKLGDFREGIVQEARLEAFRDCLDFMDVCEKQEKAITGHQWDSKN